MGVTWLPDAEQKAYSQALNVGLVFTGVLLLHVSLVLTVQYIRRNSAACAAFWCWCVRRRPPQPPRVLAAGGPVAEALESRASIAAATSPASFRKRKLGIMLPDFLVFPYLEIFIYVFFLVSLANAAGMLVAVGFAASPHRVAPIAVGIGILVLMAALTAAAVVLLTRMYRRAARLGLEYVPKPRPPPQGEREGRVSRWLRLAERGFWERPEGVEVKLLEPLRTEHYLTAGAFNPAAALAAADPDARLTHLSRLATRFSRMASTLTFLNSSRRDRDREMFDTGSPAGKDAAAAAAVTVAVAGAGAGAAAAAAALASDGDGMAGSGVDGGREGVEGLSAVVVRPSALRIAGMEGALGGSSHSSSVSGIADGCTGGGGGGDSARGTLVGGSSFFNQSRRSNRVSASNAPLSDGEASSMTGSASAAAVAVRTGPPPFAERRSASGAVSVGAWGSFTPGTGGGSTNGMAPPAPASVDAAAAGGAIVGRASASGTVVVASASAAAAAGSRPGSGMPHRSESGSLAAALLGHFRRGGVGGGSKASSSATSATAGTAAAAAAVGPTSASRFAGPPAAPSSPPPPVPHSHSAVVDLRDNALFGDSTYSAATATPPLTPLGVAAPDAAKAALVAPHVVQTDSLLLQSGADYAAAAVLGSPTPTATAGATDVASAAAASAFMSAAAVTAASAAAAGEVDGARRSALSARPQSGRTSSNGASPVPAHAAPLLPAVITAAPVAPRVEPLGMSMPSISRRLSRAGGSSLSGAVPAAPTAGMPISSARLPSALIPEDASQDSSGATAGNAADAADPAIRDVPLPDPASQPNGPDAGPHAVRSALAGSMAAFAAALESHDSFTHASHRSPTRLSGGGGSGWHGSPRLPGAMVGSPSASQDAACHFQLEQKRRRRKSLIMADGGAALPHDSIGSPRQLSDDESEALTEAANAAAATLTSRKSGGGGGASHIAGGRSRLGAVEMTGGGPGALHMPAPPEAPLPPAPAPPPAAPVPAGTAGVAAAPEPPPQSAAARMVAAAKSLAEEFAAMEHARAQKLAQQQEQQQQQQQQQAPPAPPSRRTSLSGADAGNGSQGGGGILAAGSSALSRKSPRRTTIDGAAASSDRQMSGRPPSGRPPSGRPPSGRPNASGAAGPSRLPSAAQRNSNSISRRDSGLKGSGGAADDAVAAAAAGLGAEPSATDTAAGGSAASGFMAAGNAIVASDRLARGRPTSARASDSGLVPAPATVASPGAEVAEPASLQPAASLRRTEGGSSGRAGRTAMTAAVHAVGATTKLTAASAATAATAAAHAAAAAATAAPATAAAPAVGSTQYAASGGSTSLSSTASPSSPQSTHHYQSPPLPAAIDEKDARAAAAAWPASVPSAMPPPAIRVPSSSGDKAEMQRAAAAAAAAATANGVASGGAAKAPTVVIGSPAGVAALSTRDSVGAAKLGSPAGQEPVLPIELQIRRVEVYERYGQLFEEFRGGKIAAATFQGALLANAIVPAVLLAVQAGADMAAGSRGAKATNIALLCVKALFAIYMSAVLPFSNAITMTAELVCSWLEAAVCAGLVALQWYAGAKGISSAMAVCEVLVIALQILRILLTSAIPCIIVVWEWSRIHCCLRCRRRKSGSGTGPAAIASGGHGNATHEGWNEDDGNADRAAVTGRHSKEHV